MAAPIDDRSRSRMTCATTTRSLTSRNMASMRDGIDVEVCVANSVRCTSCIVDRECAIAEESGALVLVNDAPLGLVCGSKLDVHCDETLELLLEGNALRPSKSAAIVVEAEDVLEALAEDIEPEDMHNSDPPGLSSKWTWRFVLMRLRLPSSPSLAIGSGVFVGA